MPQVLRLPRLDAWRRLPGRVPPDLRRAIPYGLVLALALGFAVVVGANLSNAQPSEERPFGWEGPSSFENGVAMVRPDLVLATTLPALLLGARALEARDPARTGALGLVGVFGMHAVVLVLAVLAAGGIGAWGASRTPGEAYVAFCVAHGLLALAFYGIAFAWSASLKRHAMAAALASWGVFVLLYDNIVQWKVLREIGYHGATSGAFPTWFYAAQAFSPLTVYRGILILWREKFRNFVEKYALGNADLPAWLNPGTFSAVMVVMWVLVPLGIALGVWSLRRARLRRQGTSGAARPGAKGTRNP